jgi:type II secretion system protein N
MSFLDEGQLEGRLSGQLAYEARSGNLGAGQFTGDIVLDGAALAGAKVQGFTLPDLHFRQTKLKFLLHGSRLEIQDFNAAGDVNIQGSGNIVFRDPLPNSPLNLRVTLETSLATPDALKAAVGLIPRLPGAKPDAPMNITGTLGAPKFR